MRHALESLLRTHGIVIGSITVTGHSLGGALASIAAYDVGLRLSSTAPGSIRDKLAKEGVKIRDNIHVSAITFASPRVGNPDFKAAVKKAGVKMLRVVNYRDVVPQVPGEEPQGQVATVALGCHRLHAWWCKKTLGQVWWLCSSGGCKPNTYDN